MQKGKSVIIFLAFLVFALGALLLKENQRANAAESKLGEAENKLSTISDEKENLINELQFQVTTLNGKLSDAEADYKALADQKETEMQQLTDESAAKDKQHETELTDKSSEISQLEEQSKEDKEKFNTLLDEKNAQIEEFLKKINTLEAKNLENESKANQLARTNGKLTSHNERLLEVIRNNETHKAALD